MSSVILTSLIRGKHGRRDCNIEIILEKKSKIFTTSLLKQNHRLWLRHKDTSGDHLVQLLLRAGSLRIDCLGPWPVGLWISPRWIFHSLFVQPAPLLDHPESKEVFSFVHEEFPVFQFINSHPATSCHREESSSVIFTLSIRDYYIQIRSSSAISRLSSPKFLSFCSNCLIIVLVPPVCPCLSCNWKLRTGTSIPNMSDQVWSTLSLLAML